MRAVLMLLACGWLACGRAHAGEWERLITPETGVSAVAVCGAGAELVYAATVRGMVWTSSDAGAGWNAYRCLKGAGRMRRLYCDPTGREVYAAADDGVYFSRDCGRRWRRIYRSDVPCLSVINYAGVVYCGTGGGIVHGGDGGAWRASPLGPGKAVTGFAASRGGLFCCATDGVFLLEQPGGAWRKLRSWQPRDPGDEGENGGEDGRQADEPAITACREGVVAAGGGEVVMTTDGGATWSDLPGLSAASLKGRLAVVEAADMFLVSRGGMYRFSDGQWRGPLAGAPRGIVSLARAGYRLYAAGEGLFRMIIDSADRAPVPSLERYIAGEPPVADVREAAIRYAGAEAEKFLCWSRQAGRKPWLPHLNLGVSRQTGDLWHWESGSTTKEGDDCLRRGKEALDWNVSLTWELGELVWSGEQSAIDVRSRLAAQLRDEIIDEVTRLYYERIRLQLEADSLPLEEERKRRLAMVKLEETTALLDGLTDGFYSRCKRLREKGFPVKDARDPRG